MTKSEGDFEKGEANGSVAVLGVIADAVGGVPEQPAPQFYIKGRCGRPKSQLVAQICYTRIGRRNARNRFLTRWVPIAHGGSR